MTALTLKLLGIVIALFLVCAVCVQWLELEQWQGWVIAIMAVGGWRLVTWDWKTRQN